MILLAFFSTISSIYTEEKCRPYKEQLSVRDAEITRLNQLLNETNSQLLKCRGDYQYLVEQNVTKKDIDEVKGYFNITQIQISNLNQKFEQITNSTTYMENNYVSVFNINLALNIVLAFEFLSFVILKNELVVAIHNRLKKHYHKKEPKREDVPQINVA
jgi:hypothetical protein